MLKLHHFRPDIPFSREDANRMMPWIVGLMVFLAGLFLCAAVSVHQASNAAGRLNVDSFQIYIPSTQDNKESLHEALVAMLRQQEDIRKIETHNAQSLAKIISPWVSRGLQLTDLPLPVVVEVTLRQGADRAARISDITTRAHAISDAIEVESYEGWVDQLLQFAGMLRLLAVLLAGLVVAGLVAMVVLAARTSLKLHFKAVQLLHHVGAQDDYIIRQFVTNVMMMMLTGAVPGVLAAGALYGMVSWFSGAMSSALLPSISFLPLHAAVLLLLPLLCLLVCYIAVRSTVQTMIEGMH